MVLVEVLIPCYMSQVDRSHLSLTGGVYLVSSLYTVQNCTTTASPLINKYFISKQVHKYLSVFILLLYIYLHLSCTYGLSTPGSVQPPHRSPTHASSQPPVCVSVPSVLVCHVSSRSVHPLRDNATSISVRCMEKCRSQSAKCAFILSSENAIYNGSCVVS